MNHDPLCSYYKPGVFWESHVCVTCDLIAKAREDMLAKCIAAVEALRPLLFVDKYDGGYDCCGCSTLDQLHDDAIVALRALSANADSDGNVSERRQEKS
jgi:hypothetical protein